ncbi:MAG: DUF4331 domain-containing protein [Chitinophagaceae bacterium]|nr:DUF4331 domain-containing protein [Rubrivivax sp.]
MPRKLFQAAPLAVAALLACAGAAHASSHREAPFITTSPKVDGTDFYMFRSYETGRADYVTLIANYQPLQAPYGGPNYFAMDPNALYEIHIDNTGDAREDITFQFRFTNTLAAGGNGVTLNIGGTAVAIPLVQAGAVSNVKDANLNLGESYTVSVVRGDRRTGTVATVTNATGGATVFDKPVDNIGTKTIPDYAGYAARHIYTVNIPGCTQPAKVFVGQRKEAFAVNLGTIFDLVNAPLATITNPALIGAVPNTIDGANVTSLALEVHRSCLTAGTETVIGGWTTASLRQARLLNGSTPSGHQASEKPGGAWVQVSRLGMPLVNEVVIGLRDKDKFNGSMPSGDAQFATYVTNPTLPALVEIAYNAPGLAPTNFPRTDLVTTFLTGITGVNRFASTTAATAEMLRLNTATAPVPFASQNRLGIVGNILANGNDNAGYPNGRRPKDDVVDISLVAVMGGLCVANGTGNTLALGTACNPNAVSATLRANGTNGIATVFNLHDAVDQAVVPLLQTFPYLTTPTRGAP